MRIGVDLGGTKIEAVLLDANGKILFRERKSTPKNQYEQTLQTIVDLVRDAQSADAAARNASIGVAAPGAISPQTGLIKNSNSVCLIGKPLHKDLEQLLAQPVRVANDADCLALSEAVDGAASQYNSVFAVILGTGVGGGIVVNKQLLSGPNAIAGEWGHNPLPWPRSDELPGPECYCGKRGCIETFLSGTGLENDFNTTDAKLNVQGIVEKAEHGEQAAMNALNRYWDRLARAFAHVINILDPDCIVVGGGVSNIDALYEQVLERLPAYVFSDTVETRVVKARYGDSSGVRGAAWLWPQ